MDAIAQNDPNAFVQIALGSVEIDMGEELDKLTLDRMKLEKLKDFLTKSLTFVNNRLIVSSKAEVASKSKQGDTLLEIDDVQFFEPRGRFKLIISSESLVLEGKQFSCFADINNISHISCIPSNATTKKEGEDYLAIRFAKPVKINNKDVQSILGNLGKSPLKMVSSSDGYRDIETLVVCKTLQDASGVKIIRPQKHLFQTVVQQKDFLRCYKGTQEGAIYPLENGVVFVKPLLFLPAEEISSLTAGRGGGAGNTKYIDLRIESVDNKVYEFTNIERDELPALQMYVKGYLEARSRRLAASAAKTVKAEVIDIADEQEGGSASSSAAVIDVEDDDSDEDDDDYSDGGSDDESDDDSGDSEGNSYQGSSDDDDDDSDSDNEQERRGKKRVRKDDSDGEGSDSEGEGKPKKMKKSVQKKEKVAAVKHEPEVMVLGDSGVMAVDMTHDDDQEGTAATVATANPARVTPLPGSVAKRDGRKPNKDSIVKKESNGAVKVATATVAPSVSSDNLSAVVKSDVKDNEDDVEIVPAPKKERIEIEL